MPFEIVRNDITNMRVDAIVNTANPDPIVGSGLNAGIHQAAGPELLAARQKIGKISVGKAVITPGYRLNARYVIHTAGPVWRGGILGEEYQLYRCYTSALELAAEYGCNSVAFPLISTGNYRFPKGKALSIAVQAIREFLSEHEMQIFLVVFDRESFRLSEALSREVSSYIDEHYIRQVIRQEYVQDINQAIWPERPSRAEESRMYEAFSEAPSGPFRDAAPQPKASRKSPLIRPRVSQTAPAPSLDQLLKKLDAGFTDTFRFRNPDAVGCYTWWSYMYKARQNNAGWRIDYFLVSDRLRPQIKDTPIYHEIQGSDHCPVGLELQLED